MDQGWIKVGHIQGDGVVPFVPPEIVIWGPYRGPKWPKLAINGVFLAKSAPGATPLRVSQMPVLQCGEHKNVVPLVSSHEGNNFLDDTFKKRNFCPRKTHV